MLPMNLPSRARGGFVHVVVDTPKGSTNKYKFVELPNQQLNELEFFFINYNKVQGRQFSALGRRGPEAAERLLRAGIQRAQHETRSRSR